MRRPRRRAAHRRRPRHPRQGRHACARARSRRGRSRRRPITSRRWKRSASTTSSRSTPSGRTCRRRPRTPSSTAPATTTSSSPTTTACAPTRPRSRSRASSPISSAAAKETESEWAREELQKYFTDMPCDACNGYRLKPEALCVKIGGKHIGEVVRTCRCKRAGEWFTELPKQLNTKQNEIAVRVLKEIRERLKFLVDVGLEYLTLVARLRHAVRRREPAHPPRLADRLRPHRRALRAGRAVDRPAPARQRAAARNAASGCATSATP